MEFRLFYSSGTIALATLIALFECEAEFDIVKVDFKSAQQTQPEYLTVNPKGRVPALQTAEGMLTETLAILVYLAQAHSHKNLLPANTYEFAQLQSFNSYLASTVHVNHAHKRRGSRWAELESSFDDMRAKVPETMLASFELIQQEYLQGPWVMGQQYTVADAYLFTITGWLEGDGVPLEKLPKISDHYSRMQQRAAVQRALQV